MSAARELGLTVFEAASAEVALQHLEAHPDVEVLLTDIVMPGTNGRKLADQATARWPGLNVVYMTGYTRNAIIHNGMLDPGTLLLTKPFTVNELVDSITRVLQLAS